MAARDDGGQAFPQPVTVGPNDDLYPAYPGMTLRDWFAGQALTGLVAFDRPHAEGNKPEHFGRWAYAIADAMIAERSKEVT